MPVRITMRHTAAAVVAAAAVAGCGGSDDGGDRAPTAAFAPAAARVADDVAAAQARRAPAPGRVRLEDGPFTDRVRASRLRIHPGRRPHVTGRLLNVTDVSEVLYLEIHADFYDRRGRRVGAGTVVFEEAEEFHAEALRFRVRAKRPAPRAVSAVLTIPQLVNE